MKHAVLDLPLCLGELKHRASLLTMDVCLCGAILNLKAYLFRSDSRHNDRVDSLLECATKQVVMTVAQRNRYQIVRGLYLLGSK